MSLFFQTLKMLVHPSIHSAFIEYVPSVCMDNLLWEFVDYSVKPPGELIGPRILWDPGESKVIEYSLLRLLDLKHSWVPVSVILFSKQYKIEIHNIL
jgi:hypothetical protein